MRVVFMGTPSFAVPSLEAVTREHELVAVYTRPDSGSGRGRRETPSPVKVLAESLEVPVEQPQRFDADAVASLAAYEPDVICVAAFGLILPETVLGIPPLGAINVHASLLPRWRGAAPVERAILARDSTTGVSIMLMEAGLDTGPVAAAAALEIGDSGAEELTARLAILGAETLVSVLAMVEEGSASWAPQPSVGVTYADKVFPADVSLDPKVSMLDNLARVRASSRRAPARARVCGVPVTVLSAAESECGPATGVVELGGQRLLLGASNGCLEVRELRPENRATMSGAAFANGLRGDFELVWEAPL